MFSPILEEISPCLIFFLRVWKFCYVFRRVFPFLEVFLHVWKFYSASEGISELQVFPWSWRFIMYFKVFLCEGFIPWLEGYFSCVEVFSALKIFPVVLKVFSLSWSLCEGFSSCLEVLSFSWFFSLCLKFFLISWNIFFVFEGFFPCLIFPISWSLFSVFGGSLLAFCPCLKVSLRVLRFFPCLNVFLRVWMFFSVFEGISSCLVFDSFFHLHLKVFLRD